MDTRIEFRPTVYVAMAGAVLLSSIATFLITESVVATILANTIAFGVLGLLYLELQHHDIDDKRALTRFVLDIRQPSLAGLAFAVIAVAVGVLIRLGVGTVKSAVAPTQATASHSVTTNPAPGMLELAAIAAAVVVFGPLVEELVFRGLLQRLLTRHTGPAVAIAVTASVFAVMHIPNYGGFATPLAQLAIPMTVLAADSVLWGYLYHRTGNVAVAWLAHAGSNAVALALWVT